MIKSSKQIHAELKKMIGYPSKESEDMLRKWACSVIDECAIRADSYERIQDSQTWIKRLKEQL